MSNKPIKNDDVIVMFSAALGTEYGIDKITGLKKDKVFKLLQEMMELSNSEVEFEPEEYLEKAGAMVEPIFSSSGMNDDKGIFYDFDFSYDAGIVIKAEDFSIKKQSENLMNRLNFSNETLSETDAKADEFEIYQIRSYEKFRNIRFENMEALKRFGLKIEYDNYNFVYTGKLNNMDLEDIFEKFNIDRPEDFKGHSLSVSDIVVLNKNGEDTAYFVDSFGFKNVPEFILSKEKSKNKISSDKEFSIVEALKENKEKIKAKESVNKIDANKSFNER